MKTQKIYLFSLVFVLCLCFKGQTAFAEEALQIEDNWLTQEVARQVGKSDIKTLTQDDFEGIKQINMTDSESNTILSIPKEISLLKNLTTLMIPKQRISILPKELYSLNKLKKINFYKNNFNEIPKELFDLELIESINFTENQISKVPGEITKLKYLKSLELVNNQLTEIPKEILQLSSLTLLNLNGNQIEEIPKEIKQLINLTNLQLGYNNIDQIPEEVFTLKNLGVLHLSNNNIRTIPENISKLTKLYGLILSNNKINKVPESIGLLSNLTLICLDCNEIIDFPELDVNHLYFVKKIYLQSNKLKIFPSFICDLPNLVEINLYNNDIDSIPANLKSLTKLKNINIYNNHISDIPFEISGVINAKGQTITLSEQKVNKNSTFKIKNTVSAINSVIDFTINNGGVYNKDTDNISWTITASADKQLSYSFNVNNEHLYFSGTVIQPIEIAGEEQIADNKIFFTEDYSAITFTKNESIRIPINLSTIKDYYALDGSVQYDKTKLEFLGYTVKNNYKDCYADSSGADTLRFILASKGKDNPIQTADEPILYLNFKCIDSGDAEIEITSAALADLKEEADIKKEFLDRATIHITESSNPSTNDVNRDGKFSLVDLAIDAYYYGISADETDKTKYDADIVPDGVIDDLDLMEITKNIIANKK